MIRLSNTGGANRETKIHATQKPVPLYKKILVKCAQPENKIIDTHGGSFPSYIACYDLGFDFMGFEKDADIYDMAMRRIKEHTAQQKMNFAARAGK